MNIDKSGKKFEYMSKQGYLSVEVIYGDEEFESAIKEFVVQYGKEKLGKNA